MSEEKNVASLIKWEIGQEPSNIYWAGCCCCLAWAWMFHTYFILKALKTIDPSYDSDSPLNYLKAYITIWGYIEAEFKIQAEEKVQGITNDGINWFIGLIVYPLGLQSQQRRINKLAGK